MLAHYRYGLQCIVTAEYSIHVLLVDYRYGLHCIGMAEYSIHVLLWLVIMYKVLVGVVFKS